MIKDEVLKSFKKTNCLVTGGTGLIGRQVVDVLCAADANVTSVSLDQLQLNSKARYMYGDLTEFSFCKDITKNMDFVFHLAGIKGSLAVSKTHVASHFVPTLMFNVNTLEAARLNKVRKLVFTSSIGAYAQAEIFKESDYRLESQPMDIAGWAKRMGELQIHAYYKQWGIDTFAIVRPSNVYGPGDNFDPDNAMVIPSLLWRIHRKENPVVIWGDGSAIRDFVYSRDVAEGIILALYHGTKAEFVNLGSGGGVSIQELVATLGQFLDFNYAFDVTKPAGFPKRLMDISLARQLIDYNPTTSLLEGLKATWEWFIQHEHEYSKRKNYFKEGLA
ncbi:MAG: NAD-dependent epimerase/dehydratase family protein [Candidatus Omnitrophica bacterium]|nr:NAD-dependent epimerase/dehydratase family protein [Candidatus Omnitrophota bacterium]